MSRLRPYEDKSLIATKNVLRFDAASQHVLSIADPVDFNGATPFCISLLLYVNTPQTIGEIITRRGSPGGDGSGFYLRTTANSGKARLQFGVNSSTLVLTEVLLPLLDVHKWYRVTIIYEPFDGANTYVSCKINNGATVRTTFTSNPLLITYTQNLYIGSSYLYAGLNRLSFDGYIGNVIFLDIKPGEKELETLHHTNIIPPSLHSNVTGHYPLNQNSGAVAFDVVEQYNYAKVTKLGAKHAELVNYSASEVGSNNVLLQSAYQNLYSESKKGFNFLKGNGINLYSQVPVYSAAPTQWSLYLEASNMNLENPAFRTVFSASETNAGFACFFVGSANIQFYYNGSQIINTGTTPGIIKIWLIYDGTNTKAIQNGIIETDIPNVNLGFPFFRFLWQNAANGLYSNQGIARAVFLDKPVSGREIKLIENGAGSDDYKSISNIQLDLNFGDVFFNTNYFVRDNSGNNRHAQLYNFTPATDQPLRIEQSTGLPERRKALRLVRANSNFLSVANFNPTKEKGYTYILGFSQVTQIGTERFLTKRDNGNTKAKLLYSTPILVALAYDISLSLNNSSGLVDFANYDTSKPNFVVIVAKSSGVNVPYINGLFSQTVQMLDPYGWDEVGNSDLYIGTDAQNSFAGNTNNLDGFLFHLSIYKGALTQPQVLDIINNGLAGNATPELMTDCQLYLNFEEIINDSGTYKIKDWSPQNRTVILNNYSANDINPAHADYKLLNLDTLR
jgi:hypothetical protein